MKASNNADWVEFGRRLSEARGRKGLRVLEREQEQWRAKSGVVSRAQLSRYERGEVLPPLRLAEHLDRLYEANGWAANQIRTLWRDDWVPWVSENPGRLHSASWPADFSGVVWIKLIPNSREVDHEYSVHIEWGPWERSATLQLSAAGAVLLTGKAKDLDGVSRTLNLESDRRVHSLAGFGEELSGETIVDIRRGWTLVSDDGTVEERLHGPGR